MRLYSRTGATVLTDPEYGTFEGDENGAFEFPDDLAERLRRFHVGKQPMWEDDIERQRRLMDEELERAKDPATLLGVVQQLAQLFQGATAAAAPAVAEAEAAPKPAAKRAAKRAAPSTPAVE